MSNLARRGYGLWTRVLIALVERAYGPRPSLKKLRALEVMSISAYRGCIGVTAVAQAVAQGSPAFADRLAGFIGDLRECQREEKLRCDALEQLMYIQGFARRRRAQLGLWALALACSHATGLLFVSSPRWASRAAAELEDHVAWTYWQCASREDAELAWGPEGRAILWQIASEKDRHRRVDLALAYGRLVPGDFR